MQSEPRARQRLRRLTFHQDEASPILARFRKPSRFERRYNPVADCYAAGLTWAWLLVGRRSAKLTTRGFDSLHVQPLFGMPTVIRWTYNVLQARIRQNSLKKRRDSNQFLCVCFLSCPESIAILLPLFMVKPWRNL